MEPSSENEHKENRISSTVLFFVVAGCFLLYLLTLQPAIGWGDSAKLAGLSFRFEFKAHQGYHNLRTLVGALFGLLARLFPAISYAWSQNAVSALFGSLSVGVLFLICRKRNVSTYSAALAALCLGLSHIFWHLSVITESYTLTSFLFLLTVLFTLDWLKHPEKKKNHLYLALFITGLGVTNSMLFLALLPGFVFLMIRKSEQGIDLKSAGLGIGSFFLGSSFLLVLFAISVAENGMLQALTIYFQPGYASNLFVLHPGKAVIGLVRYPLYLFYQFPLFGFLLGGIGIWLQYNTDRDLLWFLALPFLLVVLFSSTYMEQRKFYIMLPTFLIYAIWIGEGIGWLIASARVSRAQMKSSLSSILLSIGLVLVISPLLLYLTVLTLNDRFRGIELYGGRNLPYRQDRAYYLQPWKNGHNGTEQLWHQVRQLPPGSVLIADYTPAEVIRYYRGLEEKKEPLHLYNPVLREYQRDTAGTIRKFLNSRPEDTTSSRNLEQPPGVFMLNSHPVYRRTEVEKHFDIYRADFIQPSKAEKKERSVAGGRSGLRSGAGGVFIYRILPD